MNTDSPTSFADLDSVSESDPGDSLASALTDPATEEEIEWAREILAPIPEHLSTLLGYDLRATLGSVVRQRSRPAGHGSVHISFKLGFKSVLGNLHGCWLVPFPQAATLAGWMMQLPEDELAQMREATALDSVQKDAMLEIGNLIASAAGEATEPLGFRELRVRAEGCQGVRDGVRPALVYEDGDPLVVAKAELEVAGFPPTETVLVLPDLMLVR